MSTFRLSAAINLESTFLGNFSPNWIEIFQSRNWRNRIRRRFVEDVWNMSAARSSRGRKILFSFRHIFVFSNPSFRYFFDKIVKDGLAQVRIPPRSPANSIINRSLNMIFTASFCAYFRLLWVGRYPSALWKSWCDWIRTWTHRYRKHYRPDNSTTTHCNKLLKMWKMNKKEAGVGAYWTSANTCL